MERAALICSRGWGEWDLIEVQLEVRARVGRAFLGDGNCWRAGSVHSGDILAYNCDDVRVHEMARTRE